MRLLLPFLLVLLSISTASAQEEKAPPFMGLEAEIGANLAVSRKPRVSGFSADNLRVQPGYQLGLNLVLWPTGPSSLIFGATLLEEKGTLTNYRSEGSFSDRGAAAVGEPFQRTTGELDINERWLRGSMEGHFRLGKLVLIAGLELSASLSGSMIYNYTTTTNAWFEPITGRVVAFEEPIVRNGSRDLVDQDFRPGHAGAIFGLGYEPTDRLSVRLKYDVGVRFGPAYEEYRMRRARLGITAAYRFWAPTS